MREMTASMDPAALCEQLCAAFPRRAASVRRLHDVCAAMAQTPGVVFSIATVAAACAPVRFTGDEPGPAAGTIRNPEGEPYRQLIAAFARRHPSPKPKRSVAPSEAELSRASPRVRHRVRQLERSLAALQAEIKVLRAESGRLTAAPPTAVPTEERLWAAGLEGLRDWLSPAHQASRGWSVDRGGRLLDARGTTLMASAPYRTLRDVVARFGADDSTG